MEAENEVLEMKRDLVSEAKRSYFMQRMVAEFEQAAGGIANGGKGDAYALDQRRLLGMGSVAAKARAGRVPDSVVHYGVSGDQVG
jgi:hypothetical protein